MIFAHGLHSLHLHCDACNSQRRLRQTEFNPTPTSAENESLSDIIQLTANFDRAGEAYFSHDMRWIIFEASPHGEPNYQMYLVRLRPIRQAGGLLASVCRFGSVQRIPAIPADIFHPMVKP